MKRLLKIAAALIAAVIVSGYGTFTYQNRTPAQLKDPNYFLAALKEVLQSYDFSRTELVQSQDHFADPYNNSNGTYLSTNVAFWDGIRDDFDYAINVPIEFFAENTDTLYSHAMFNFEFFPTYDRYESIDYPDSGVPYVREFDVEGTRVIYNGLPIGDYNKPIIEAYAQAFDSILSQRPQPA